MMIKMLLWSQQTYLDTIERSAVDWTTDGGNGFCLPAYCYPSGSMDGVGESHGGGSDHGIRWWTTDWEEFTDAV